VRSAFRSARPERNGKADLVPLRSESRRKKTSNKDAKRVKHEESTAAYALEGVSEGVKGISRAAGAGPKKPTPEDASEKVEAHPKKAAKTRQKARRRAA
jgi:hypothetical protein